MNEVETNGSPCSVRENGLGRSRWRLINAIRESSWLTFWNEFSIDVYYCSVTYKMGHLGSGIEGKRYLAYSRIELNTDSVEAFRLSQKQVWRESFLLFKISLLLSYGHISFGVF